MPIVAMNRMIGAWLTSGRRTMRSITSASTIMMAMVMAKASHGLRPKSSISPAKNSTANSTMAPWAKLNTPDALKIRTKPSATSEYMTPAIRPPISTSTKNSGTSAIITKGSTKMASSTLMSAASRSRLARASARNRL